MFFEKTLEIYTNTGYGYEIKQIIDVANNLQKIQMTDDEETIYATTMT